MYTGLSIYKFFSQIKICESPSLLALKQQPAPLGSSALSTVEKPPSPIIYEDEKLWVSLMISLRLRCNGISLIGCRDNNNRDGPGGILNGVPDVLSEFDLSSKESNAKEIDMC